MSLIWSLVHQMQADAYPEQGVSEVKIIGVHVQVLQEVVRVRLR